MSVNNNEDEATIGNQTKRSKINNHVFFQSEAFHRKKIN